MLILVAVTITIAVNGGLFGYAGKATKDTELAKQEEQKLAEGSLEVDGKLYNSPKDYIEGIEATPQYSESLLDANGVLTKTAEYTDTNNETAIVPKGYAIVENCETINQGLVISDEEGNEFVWIPVPEKNMKVATLSDPYIGATHYAEPKELTATDSYTNSQTGGPYAYDSQGELDYYYGANYFTYTTDFAYEAHYKEMAESVNKYGGFYIGRYETTIDSNNNIGSKYNTTILLANKKIKTGTNPNNNQSYNYRWWGLYAVQRHANIAENESTVQTNMVWGQQWDKMIAYFDSKSISYAAISTSMYYKPSSVLASGQATYTNKNDSTDVIKDKIYNIYDLRMNAWDWTAEGSYTDMRVNRGGGFGNIVTASYRTSDYSPSGSISDSCTRLTLYIK